MNNFVRIYRTFLAKTEDAGPLFRHKFAQVEGLIPVTAVFKQQYQKTLTKTQSMLQGHP